MRMRSGLQRRNDSFVNLYAMASQSPKSQADFNANAAPFVHVSFDLTLSANLAPRNKNV